MTARTVGVEEEFLLFEADRPRLLDVGPPVVAAAERPGDGDAQFEKELKKAQVEHASSPTSSLDDLRADLTRQRAALVDSAARRQARVVASGTCPVESASATTEDERYQRMERRFAEVLRSELTCAMHVHVSVESDDEAIAVIDGIAPWLPVLSAITANSPLHAGHDTGYSSFRRILWNQWPTAGPTGAFGDPAAYERAIGGLIASGAAQDRGMIYFDARRAADYPTVEIRVCDVCPFIDDAVTVAALARALVETVAAQNGADTPRVELLRAASWRAARFGLAGELVDPRALASGALLPAWSAVAVLTEHVGAALDAAGDADTVHSGLNSIRDRGTGAERQRAAAADGGAPAAVLAMTISGAGQPSSRSRGSTSSR